MHVQGRCDSGLPPAAGHLGYKLVGFAIKFADDKVFAAAAEVEGGVELEFQRHRFFAGWVVADAQVVGGFFGDCGAGEDNAAVDSVVEACDGRMRESGGGGRFNADAVRGVIDVYSVVAGALIVGAVTKSQRDGRPLICSQGLVDDRE